MPTKPPLLTFVLVLCPVVVAQPPTPEQLARRAYELVQQLGELRKVEQPTAAQKTELAAKQKELAAFVATCVAGEGFSERHFVEASSPLLGEECVAEGLAISESGAAKFPESRFLNDHVGFGNTGIAFAAAPSAARIASLRAAEAAFRKALQCKPDTWHAHYGLYQVLEFLGTCDEALRELDIAAKDAEGAKQMSLLWLRRSVLLMRTGKAKDAIALLKGVAPEDDEKLYVEIMRLRATALSGDAAATQAAVTALRAMESSPRTLVDAADALAYVGKKPDALKLLAQRPARAKSESEEQREAQLYSQSAEAMEAFLKATDFSHTGPLRGALSKALDHHYYLFAGGKQSDFASSPRMMSKLLGGSGMPAEPIKDWGNHTLFVLSMRAAPAHKPPPDEQKFIDLLKNDRWPTADDIPARLLALRYQLNDPEAAGVLTGLRAVEKLEAKSAASPAKK